jgi:hypothetical protein
MQYTYRDALSQSKPAPPKPAQIKHEVLISFSRLVLFLDSQVLVKINAEVLVKHNPRHLFRNNFRNALQAV